eukprot:IDg11969t1
MDRLVSEAVSLATCSGILMSAKGDTDVHHTSFTLHPSPVQRHEFEEGLALAPLLNTLTARIASDHDFLRTVLRDTAHADEEFTGRLLRLLDIARPPGTGVEFTINRYDYFVAASENANAPAQERGLRLIELNCIAAGIVTQAGLTSDLHGALRTHPATVAAGSVDAYGDADDLPSNDSVGQIARSVAAAHEHFVRLSGAKIARVVMIVVPPLITRVIRCFALALDRHGALIVRNLAGIERFTVSVAYFRTGYAPYEYNGEHDWRGRELIERSTAVACPSVAMQLVGTKKMQQVLGEVGVLERFLGSAGERVRDVLVKQFDIAPGKKGDHAVSLAVQDPDAYERAKYVLMERIHSTPSMNVVVRAGKWERCEVVSELGFFGSIITVDGDVVENKTVGHCIKSKKATVDDGGIIVGVAVLDSPRLVD